MTEILLDSDVIIAWLRGCHPFAGLIPELVSKANLFVHEVLRHSHLAAHYLRRLLGIQA